MAHTHPIGKRSQWLAEVDTFKSELDRRPPALKRWAIVGVEALDAAAVTGNVWGGREGWGTARDDAGHGAGELAERIVAAVRPRPLDPRARQALWACHDWAEASASTLARVIWLVARPTEATRTRTPAEGAAPSAGAIRTTGETWKAEGAMARPSSAGGEAEAESDWDRVEPATSPARRTT